MGRAPYVVGASIAATLIAVNPSMAHPEFNAVSTNRYVKLDLVAPDEVRLAYTIMFGSTPALAARKAADANADGKLDAAEQRALGEKVKSDVLYGLKLEGDGRPLLPSFEAPQVGLMGDEVGPNPFSVDLIAHLSLPAAPEHRLVVDDKTELPQLGETEVRIEESPQTRLLEGKPHTTFRGPRLTTLEDRSVALRFAAAPGARPQPKKGVPWPVALAVSFLLLVVGGAVLLRRYRNMKGY